jgi:hypothetical protein
LYPRRNESEVKLKMEMCEKRFEIVKREYIEILLKLSEDDEIRGVQLRKSKI